MESLHVLAREGWRVASKCLLIEVVSRSHEATPEFDRYAYPCLQSEFGKKTVYCYLMDIWAFPEKCLPKTGKYATPSGPSHGPDNACAYACANANLKAPPQRYSSILSSFSSASRPNKCTAPSIAATSSPCILLPTPLHSPSLTPPCSSSCNPLVRSKCRRVRVSIYIILSARALSRSTSVAAAAGRVCTFGRRPARRVRSAGSCDSAKLTFVVSGAREDEPTPRVFAEGFSCRKANAGGFVGGLATPGSWSLGSEPVRLEGLEERRDRNCASVASLRADSSRSAVWSFCVSWSVRRCRLMDSGVGLSGELLNDRFYSKSRSALVC